MGVNMTKRKAKDMENARQFMGELISEFISNPELEALDIDTQAGHLSLCKRESVRQIGFDTGKRENTY